MSSDADQVRRNVTIEDVARLAGVSRQTVSRVINRSPNVKPAVRERIEAAVEQLGYVANLSARRMGGGRSFLILAVNDRARTVENWQAGRGNDWVDQMLFGGMTECQRHGYHLLFELVDTQPGLGRRQLSAAVASLRPDGVILTPPHSDNDELAALLEQRGIACARIGRREGRSHIDVFMDEAGAAAEVTRHLIGLGHRSIAFLAGDPGYGNSRLRVQGFRRAMQEAGIKANPLVGTGDFHFDHAARVVEQWLRSDHPPTAIIADNDQMAFAVLHLADRHGLAVPGQLSLVSFEDTPGVRLTIPPMTAVRQPTARMIAVACERLIAVSRGEDRAGAFQIDFDLIVRETTGPAKP